METYTRCQHLGPDDETCRARGTIRLGALLVCAEHMDAVLDLIDRAEVRRDARDHIARVLAEAGEATAAHSPDRAGTARALHVVAAEAARR